MEEKADGSRRDGALQGPNYVSLATRLARDDWHPDHRLPCLARAGLDHVGLLFRCFLASLPLHRIRGRVPRSARKDGNKLVSLHGLRFAEHLERTEGRGPDRATLPDLMKGMWSFWFPYLSTSHLRFELEPDLMNNKDSYRVNDLEWRGFYISNRELSDAINQSVVGYSVARPSVGRAVD